MAVTVYQKKKQNKKTPGLSKDLPKTQTKQQQKKANNPLLPTLYWKSECKSLKNEIFHFTVK